MTQAEQKSSEADTMVAKRHLIFFLVLLALIGGAILRSSIATRLDSFTLDEAYHIGAGVAYVRTGDFRLNPEHPPLVKLWVGAFVAAQGFQLSPYRAFEDKYDERRFVETDVYVNNDPDLIQSRSRHAMFALNGLLLFLFAMAARLVFGDLMALAATAFLAIDPTVAAHLPVVMTDLPVALLSSTAVLLAVAAFRSWRITDLILAALALGLALGAKHSGVITLAAVALIGILSAIFWMKRAKPLDRVKRLGAVAAVLIAAVIVLWSLYLFRFNESSGTSEEQFNRPLATKISDLKTPVYRTGLNVMADLHLFPRAYIWGMADTIRAGAESGATSILFFGNLYYSRGPLYYFPAVIAAKLQLGLILLTAIGVGLWAARRIERDWDALLISVVILTSLFLLSLMKGASYAGIRHSLPIVPPLALLGSLSIYQAVKRKSYLLRGTVAIALIAAIVSAIPVMRPWEYYNEAVGGTANGHRYFNDEGVDLSLRTKELAEYYDQNLKPNGEIPYIRYYASDVEQRGRGLDWIGKDPERDASKMSGDTQSGTFIVGARAMAPSLFWDMGKSFREATPMARFGNLFIFRGTFPNPAGAQAASLFFRAIEKLQSPEPDTEGGIKLITESLELDRSPFFVWLELGNQYLKLGDREKALGAYQKSYEHAPKSDSINEVILEQIRKVESEPLDQISPLRNPGAE
ncbi:MAG: phospholipid carrier-dependent glycosyltransferase [Pyrinomonadaceae bacterium]